MNSSDVHNGDELRRKAMKRRLSNWDSFFSQVEETFGGSLADDELHPTDAGISLDDPQFVKVQEEHSKIREALRLEHGINEDSEISEAETDAEIQDANNETGPQSTDEEILSLRFQITNDKSDLTAQATRQEKKLESSKNPLKVSIWRQNYLAKTKPKPRRKRKNVENTKDFSKKENNEKSGSLLIRQGKVIQELKSKPTDKGYNVPKIKDFSQKENNEKSGSFQKGKMIYEPKSPRKTVRVQKTLKDQQDPKTHINVRPTRNRIGKESRSSLEETSDSIFQLPSASTCEGTALEPDQCNYQPVSAENIVEMCKQYDLWKQHKRRRSGKHGSLYIVSSFNEKPSDANRYVTELPPVDKNPFSFPKRFTLKGSYFSR